MAPKNKPTYKRNTDTVGNPTINFFEQSRTRVIQIRPRYLRINSAYVNGAVSINILINEASRDIRAPGVYKR